MVSCTYTYPFNSHSPSAGVADREAELKDANAPRRRTVNSGYSDNVLVI